MSQEPYKTTCKGKEYLGKTTEVMTQTFLGDPLYTWLLQAHAADKQEPVLFRLLTAFLTACALNHGLFLEADGFGCCAVLMPPGRKADNPWTMIPAGVVQGLFTIGIGAVKRAIFDYSAAQDMYAKALNKEEQKKHWYVFIMGTLGGRRRQGLAGVLLGEMKERARSDGRPLWLEATTPLSRDLYKKHGFTTVGELVLGKGTTGAGGLREKGGPGVTVWSMVWRPT
ncbi:hypothetical protein B0T24DRAFT_111586 [Lasiosphaeria ovina]|uniref:N-acetyltransferase domain-containing protein n=1 Tax=Lasiosphaeria ovina TaxID=92902 RepID=A0AAE0MYC7_9PEZI|nr:hypothetical protein B0T24DRAFT_111586 [Lasiosphaeria ovina]